jgi:hypothetical protein
VERFLLVVSIWTEEKSSLGAAADMSTSAFATAPAAARKPERWGRALLSNCSRVCFGSSLRRKCSLSFFLQRGFLSLAKALPG